MAQAIAETQRQLEMCETPELRETVISNGLNSFMMQSNEDDFGLRGGIMQEHHMDAEYENMRHMSDGYNNY